MRIRYEIFVCIFLAFVARLTVISELKKKMVKMLAMYVKNEEIRTQRKFFMMDKNIGDGV